MHPELQRFSVTNQLHFVFSYEGNNKSPTSNQWWNITEIDSSSHFIH